MHLNHLAMLFTLSKAHQFEACVIDLNKHTVSGAVIVFSLHTSSVKVLVEVLILASSASLLYIGVIIMRFRKD